MSAPSDFLRILAATDLSESSLPALRYAQVFAKEFSAALTVMYSDPILYPVDVLGHSASLFITPTAQDQKRLRDQVKKHAQAAITEWPYEIEVSIGQPIIAIVETARAREADLIVVGTHLRHGWRRALLGSVSDGVIHASPCPVLTVARQDVQTAEIRNIVCPVNFTEVARDSLRVAAGTALRFGARLIVAHVIEGTDVPERAADERRLRSWIEPEVQDRTAFTQLVVHGGASERVLDLAEEEKADLLVIGAQHHLFRETTVIGTTSERLIRFASCPVLIVPREVEARVKQRIESEQLVTA